MGDQGDSDPAAGARAATARGARGVQPQGGHHQRVHRAPRVRPRHAAVEPHESSRQKRPSRPLYGRPARASPCRAARRRQAEGNARSATSATRSPVSPGDRAGGARRDARVRTLSLDVPGWPGHRAGQHADVRLTSEDGVIAQRPYSIASAPRGPVRRADRLAARRTLRSHRGWRARCGRATSSSCAGLSAAGSAGTPTREGH
jgi:hypothetical protein